MKKAGASTGFWVWAKRSSDQFARTLGARTGARHELVSDAVETEQQGRPKDESTLEVGRAAYHGDGDCECDPDWCDALLHRRLPREDLLLREIENQDSSTCRQQELCKVPQEPTHWHPKGETGPRVFIHASVLKAERLVEERDVASEYVDLANYRKCDCHDKRVECNVHVFHRVSPR